MQGKYKGKSIIIRNAGVLVLVGSTPVAQTVHAWFHCHFCAGSMLLG